MHRVLLLVTLFVAYLTISAAQCTDPNRCQAPARCCADKLNGELCYIPGVTHDCVASTTGGFMLCPPGQRACGNQCYLLSQHQCINNVLIPVIPTPNCPASVVCNTAGGESCCNDKLNGPLCYRPGISHDCVASTSGGFMLCPPGQLSCGNQCFLSSQYQCVNNVLIPITAPAATPGGCPASFQCNASQQCCLDKFHGAQCFDPLTLDCVTSSAGGFVLCPEHYVLCNDKLNGEQCYLAGISHDCVASTTGGFMLCPPGQLACGNVCYQSSQQRCVNNVLVPITNTPSPCPASFSCNTAAGESCCNDKRNGPLCFRAGISHDCVTTTTGFMLCPPGQLGCGNFCYNPQQYQCVNDSTLVPAA